MSGFCDRCQSPVGCAGANACLIALHEAVEQAKANRMEIVQNGTCAYMSPRSYGLWVNWHIIEKMIAALDPKFESARGGV